MIKRSAYQTAEGLGLIAHTYNVWLKRSGVERGE